MRTTKRKALIIGCGMAGPVAAILLQRVGMEAEIYEARNAPDDYAGLFLNTAWNGLDVLTTVGLEGPVAAEGSLVPRMIMWSGKGKRGVLNQILREEAKRQGIKIEFGKKLQGLEVTSEQEVIATFQDGTKAFGDLLVGGDGIHSRTRQLINPGAPKPTYTGLISTGGFTHSLTMPPTPDTQLFVFGKRAFFGYHVRSSGEIYWFVNFPQAKEPGWSELKEIVIDEWKQRLLDLFREDQPFIRDMILAKESNIIGYAIYDIPTQPIWHKGQVVLVGDAIHAVSPSAGQGASLALEDAIVLALDIRSF